MKALSRTVAFLVVALSSVTAQVATQSAATGQVSTPPGFAGTWKVTGRDGKPEVSATSYIIGEGQTPTVVKLMGNFSRSTWRVDGVERNPADGDFERGLMQSVDQNFTGRWDGNVLELKETRTMFFSRRSTHVYTERLLVTPAEGTLEIVRVESRTDTEPTRTAFTAERSEKLQREAESFRPVPSNPANSERTGQQKLIDAVLAATKTKVGTITKDTTFVDLFKILGAPVERSMGVMATESNDFRPKPTANYMWHVVRDGSIVRYLKVMCDTMDLGGNVIGDKVLKYDFGALIAANPR